MFKQPCQFNNTNYDSHKIIQCTKCKILTSIAECDSDYINLPCTCGDIKEDILWSFLNNNKIN
ncbi:putative orfan [Tupanvirus soda lake]|uniref:Orfan n=2 Tax=Tupanvirus TaxID=2094720 RepID=A0AC62ABY0_9VIRU|nr:putative orfan [Tupanvirus soda lake]QKU35302.1 putative orfan [Tupanvirus soda lake]